MNGVTDKATVVIPLPPPPPLSVVVSPGVSESLQVVPAGMCVCVCCGAYVSIQLVVKATESIAHSILHNAPRNLSLSGQEEYGGRGHSRRLY